MLLKAARVGRPAAKDLSTFLASVCPIQRIFEIRDFGLICNARIATPASTTTTRNKSQDDVIVVAREDDGLNITTITTITTTDGREGDL